MRGEGAREAVSWRCPLRGGPRRSSAPSASTPPPGRFPRPAAWPFPPTRSLSNGGAAGGRGDGGRPREPGRPGESPAPGLVAMAQRSLCPGTQVTRRGWPQGHTHPPSHAPRHKQPHTHTPHAPCDTRAHTHLAQRLAHPGLYPVQGLFLPHTHPTHTLRVAPCRHTPP